MENGTTYLYLVTVNGADSGNVLEPTSGINAREFAHFMLDYLHCDQAMGMDQGGSTTMWIDGFGIVSDPDTTNPNDGPRNLFAGLFIQLLD